MKTPAFLRRMVLTIQHRRLDAKIAQCDEDIIVHGQSAMYAARRRDALESKLGEVRTALSRERV